MTSDNTPQMKCILDGTPLEPSKTSGEPSMRCPGCRGAWLSDESFQALEDSAFDSNMVKGQMRYGETETDHPCPHCGEHMTRFRYRGFNLEIDACPQDAGFWLDRGEDRNIKDVMHERAKRLRRSGSAQRSWQAARRGEKPSVLDRIRDILGM